MHRLLAPLATDSQNKDSVDDEGAGSESSSETGTSDWDEDEVAQEMRRRHRQQRKIKRGASEGLRAALVVTSEVYRRSRAFIKAVQAAVTSKPALGGPLELGLARDGIFGAFLSAYPRPELQWMMSR